ncbi:MAG: DUF3307 domain-containing protein [Marinilabilia sp.]
MIALTLKLLISHILGDFVLQPDKWVKEKQRNKHVSLYFYLHIGIHALVTWIVLQFSREAWPIILTLVISHFFIDLAKLHLEGKMNARLLFGLDQLAHLLIIGLLVYIHEPFRFNLESLYTLRSLTLILSVLILTSVSSVVIKHVMSKWSLQEDNTTGSLENAGKYIGMLERLFIFGFIVLQQWQAVGFLLAAKSVFRFSDLSRAKDRKLTEYILIGTLLSFGLAIATALAYGYAAEYWFN